MKKPEVKDEMMRRCVIFGSGGHAGSVLDCLESVAQSENIAIVGFADDHKAKGEHVHGYPVLGSCEEVIQELCFCCSSLSSRSFVKQEEVVEDQEDGQEDQEDDQQEEECLGGHVLGVVAVGDNYKRMKIVEKVESMLSGRKHVFSWMTAVHSSCTVSKTAHIGKGSVLCAGCVLGRNARVGKHAVVNTKSIVEHDCKVEDFASLATAAVMGGTCVLGERAFLGIGSSVKHGIEIARDAVVGGGSFVNRNCEPLAVYCGTPAKLLRRRSHEGDSYL